MTLPCTTSPSCAAKNSRASALVIVMLLVAVFSVVAGGLLLAATARYHTTFQSASWQESIVGAEAGVDMAMNELRKRVTQGAGAAFATNWTILSPAGTPYPNYGHAFPAGNLPYTMSTHTGEGNSALQARVYLDVPGSGVTPTVNFAVPPDNSTSTFISQLDNPSLRDPDGVDRSRWWYRIRALGTAGLSGPPVANLQKLDNQLRRFSFYTDWRTGRPVSNPQVSRLVEITAKPLTNFRNALMADKQINLNNVDVLIDSYDSSKGFYDATTNHGMMGNIATNGQLINASHATVNGDAMTNNGTVKAGENVTGQQSANFFQELTPLTPNMLNPTWSGVPNGGTLTTDASITASLDSTNPTLVHLNGINLPAGGHVISINSPTGASATTPSFVKIYVQGDIFTHDDSYIELATGVNAIVYVTGNVNLQGAGIYNDTMLASHLVLNGVQPPANPDGSYPTRTITVSTYQDLEGIVYAPNHDLTLALTAAPGSVSPGGLISLTGGEDSDAADISKQTAKLQQDLVKAQAKGDAKKIAEVQLQLKQLQGGGNAAQVADHSRGYNGIYGGFVAKTITVANKTHVHYDETLRQAGPVNHYQIVSWFEDNLSRDAAGGTEQFWWPGAKN